MGRIIPAGTGIVQQTEQLGFDVVGEPAESLVTASVPLVENGHSAVDEAVGAMAFSSDGAAEEEVE
jgi:hypothetical protein